MHAYWRGLEGIMQRVLALWRSALDGIMQRVLALWRSLGRHCATRIGAVEGGLEPLWRGGLDSIMQRVLTLWRGGLDGIMQHVLALWRRLRTNETKKVNASDRNIGEKFGRRSPMLTVSWEIRFQFVFRKAFADSNIGMNERDSKKA